MRRLALSVAAFSAVYLALIVPACSSSDAASGGDGGDGGALGPNQLVGQPCDPTLSSPCLQGNPCDTFTCDMNQEPPLCVEVSLGGPCGSDLEGGFDLESSVTDSPTTVGFGCSTDSDCPKINDGAVAFVCGFSAIDGCSATGVCVTPDPPHIADGGAVYTACGCNGQPVLYVTVTDTSQPVQSELPCSKLDGGNEAGPEAGPDGSPDAAMDAAHDAPDDASGE